MAGAIFPRPSVADIGVSFKEKARIETDQLALVILVERKLPKKN